jgi:putative hemolysin
MPFGIFSAAAYSDIGGNNLNQTILLQLFLQVVLISLNAVFACAEIAVISTNESRLDQLAANGNRQAARVLRFTRQPARFLATIQVAITLAGFLGSAFAADNFSDPIAHWLVKSGIPLSTDTLDTIAVIVITIVLSYFTLIFGELVPKRLAMKKADQMAMSMSALLQFVAHLFAPIVWILTLSTNCILRLFGVDPDAEEEEVSEEEIRMMVDAGSRKGIIDSDESKFIQNVFEFDDITVGEFATHRTDIALLWTNGTPEQWEQTIHETRHTLYPVCDGTVDHVLRILNIKDYFAIPDKSMETILQHAVHPAYFVPQTIRADILFKQMKRTRNRLAVVLDEYGGLVGIVTLNDLLEQLVGDLEPSPPQACDEQTVLKQLGDTVWQIGGGVPLTEVTKVLGLSLPDETLETFGGFVFDQYGCIPADGTQFVLDACEMHIEILKVEEHRLKKAIVHFPAPEATIQHG